MDSRELNALCKEIEIAYRNQSKRWNVRLRIIRAEEVRETILKNQIGVQCAECLKSRISARYCCSEHRVYYQHITNHFYFPQKPIDDTDPRKYGGSVKRGKVCPNCKKEIEELSIDHIVPITRGGLEFDRENLQWMCLTCNIRKSNITPEERATRSMAVFSRMLEEKRQASVSSQ
jgi:5-methylcytosine-specific restriction endonuclease McrA